MSFDERGHQPNHKIYYVNGCSGKGENPISYYPTVEDFIGEGGTYTHPRTVYEGYKGFLSHWLPVKKQTLFYYQVLPTVKKKLKIFLKNTILPIK